MFDTGGYLREHVYPALDAAEAGLLEALNPKRGQAGKHYVLTCPNCHKREGFYYIGSRYLMCNRRDECKFKQSVWDYVKNAKNLDDAGTFAELCAAAGVERPAIGNGADAGEAKEESRDRFIWRVAKDVFRELLRKDPEAMAYLQEERNLTPEQIEECPLGYYPNAATVVKALEAAGIRVEEAQRWGLLPADRGQESGYTRRVVSYWSIDGGAWRLVGRAIDKDRKPKYLYASSAVGFNRGIPYNFKFRRAAPNSAKFRSPGLTVCVEGFFDVLAYELMGVPACGIGGAEVTHDQAGFLRTHGTRTLVHVIDGDSAGRDGGTKTVFVCEGRGLPVLIGVSPQDEDADSLRKQGREAEARAVVDEAITGGEFYASELLRLLDLQGPEACELRGKIIRQMSALTPDSKLAFDLYYKRLGLVPEDIRLAAMRMATNLATDGLPWDTATKAARDRYAVDLSAAPVERD